MFSANMCRVFRRVSEQGRTRRVSVFSCFSQEVSVQNTLDGYLFFLKPVFVNMNNSKVTVEKNHSCSSLAESSVVLEKDSISWAVVSADPC